MLTQIFDFFSCNSEFTFHLFFPDFWVYILQIFLFWHYRIKMVNATSYLIILTFLWIIFKWMNLKILTCLVIASL